MTRYKHIHTATRQRSFKHLQPICGITNNPRHKGRLSQKCNERLHGLVACGTTMIKRCQGRRANFWHSYQGGDWQATCPPLSPKSQLACQAFYEIRGGSCSIRRDELRGRWLEARAHLDISRALALVAFCIQTLIWEHEVTQTTLILSFKQQNQDWLDWWEHFMIAPFTVLPQIHCKRFSYRQHTASLQTRTKGWWHLCHCGK